MDVSLYLHNDTYSITIVDILCSRLVDSLLDLDLLVEEKSHARTCMDQSQIKRST